MRQSIGPLSMLLIWSANGGMLYAADPIVSSVAARQLPLSRLVEIAYDVASPEGSMLEVSVALSDDGGAAFEVHARTFSGDVGAILSGPGKRVIWDAGTDLGAVVGSGYRARVVARQAPLPGMALVPEGEFRMGSDEGGEDERLVHAVFLDAFWIDRYEVTNAAWNAYALASGKSIRSALADHPVTKVRWFEARDYCEWAGKRLPTEAEWEKAARGTDGRTFPWGEGVFGYRANYWNSRDAFDNGTTPVGLYPEGVSAYGVYDMAGNVWEWVTDWYAMNYYAMSPERNPQGPESGSYRGVRGGSWQDNNPNYLRAANRAAHSPSDPLEALGFRCVRTAARSELGAEKGVGFSNSFALEITGEILELHPDHPWLAQPYPNPFNNTATLEYLVRDRRNARKQISIAIYGLDGQLVRTLVETSMPVGHYQLLWDGTDQSGRPAGAGMYLVALSAGQFRMARKVVLLR